MSVRERDEAGDETGERRTFFRETAVFDGLPDRPPARPRARGAPAAERRGRGRLPRQARARLKTLAEGIGYPARYREDLEHTVGLCSRKARTITVRAGIALNRTAAVLIHELGHALVAEVEETRLPAALEEVIVESVAFVVSVAAGHDVSCEAVPYIASFGGEDALEVLERSAQAIDAIARRIEDALELRSAEERPEAA